MNLTDVLTNINTFIGDSSTDRISNAERYQAATEATAWILEELGNEHMTDRAEIEFLPTVTWYKMDSLTPYLLTAGELRFKDEENNENEFTRVDSRELVSMNQNKQAYAIERFGGGSYLGITIPRSSQFPSKDIIPFSTSDSYTYTGINASNIKKEKDSLKFDMTATGVAITGVTTVTEAVDFTQYEDLGVFVFEIEIPDISGINSVSMKFGSNLSTDYFLGSVNQDVNGNALVVGVNTVKMKWSELTVIGTPDFASVTQWGFYINHETDKVEVDNFKLSDLRITKPVYLNFKYIFYRVGKNASGVDLIEFSADTDIPFFMERYPQYKFAVAHKAAGHLFKGMRLYQEAGTEDRDAKEALKRYRKNFTTERDLGSTAFRVAGINFNRRRIRRR